MDDTFFRTEPAQLRVACQAAPERPEIGCEIVEAPTHDVMAVGLDRGDADFVAAANGERQPMTLERPVGLEDHIGGRIVRVAVHRIGADGGAGRREPQIENLQPGNPQVRHDGFPCRHRSSATASTMIAPVTICCTQFG